MVRIFNAALAFALFAMPTTAIPPTDAPTVLPKLILRADIPEAVQVFEHNATTHANALETRSLLGKRSQCTNYTGYLNFSRTQYVRIFFPLMYIASFLLQKTWQRSERHVANSPFIQTRTCK
ncbi:uncharacterized protein RAG0_04246 [Rhynchosporium agropyri]|uniref:Uncharacterized protein n=1 Tax=Rhynchosporium agropyri TaxID=914238 RepID=A0A1E1K8F6_9HELO|nr:uncharacterized protein RAG0_04246 [Rhynchosporium agropyri]